MNNKEKILRQELKRLRERLKENLAKRHDAFVHGGDGWHDNFSFENLEMEHHYLSSRIEAILDELKEDIRKEKREPLENKNQP